MQFTSYFSFFHSSKQIEVISWINKTSNRWKKMNASFESKVNLIKCKISIMNYTNKKKMHMHCTQEWKMHSKQYYYCCAVRVQFGSHVYLFRLLSLWGQYFYGILFIITWNSIALRLGKWNTNATREMRATVNRKWFHLIHHAV